MSRQLKIDRQPQNFSIGSAGASTAIGVYKVGELNLDAQFKKCIGVKLIAQDNGTLNRYSVNLQHGQINWREATDYRDFQITGASDYKSSFLPLDVDAAGSKVEVKVELHDTLPAGQFVKFQLVFLLSNETEQ